MPVLASAFCMNAAAVSPLVGGFTARTIPDLQSELAAEKNQRGCVSFTCNVCKEFRDDPHNKEK